MADVLRSFGPPRGYAANTAGKSFLEKTWGIRLVIFRELAEPQKLIPYLLQTHTPHLDPDTLGVYLQAVLKIFGTWAMELSQRWDSDDLSKAKNVVDGIIDSLEGFVSSSNIEVQERACSVV